MGPASHRANDTRWGAIGCLLLGFGACARGGRASPEPMDWERPVTSRVHEATPAGSATTPAPSASRAESDGGAVTAGPLSALVDGCPGTQLREGIPTDLDAPGPWPVGALTTEIAGLQVEVWYPAFEGSADNATPKVYDTRLHMPVEEREKIPDAHNPVQPCDCFEDLPLDTQAGPYPVLLFIHGTAAFRTSNLENAVHWASRGFVVAAADHPGIQLCDMFATFTLATPCSRQDAVQGQEGDARTMLAAFAAPEGELAFLKGHVDLERVGVMGHSAGAGAAAALGDVADVVIPYAGPGASVAGQRASSALFLYGAQDGVVGGPTNDSYDGATQPIRRHVVVARGGHLTGGALCDLRDPTDDTRSIVDIANEYQLGGLIGLALVPALGGLFDGCNERPSDDTPFINGARAIQLVNYVTAGAFEETLQCSPSARAELARAPAVFGEDMDAYLETLP